MDTPTGGAEWCVRSLMDHPHCSRSRLRGCGYSGRCPVSPRRIDYRPPLSECVPLTEDHTHRSRVRCTVLEIVTYVSPRHVQVKDDRDQ
jgi:hypothetical protein